ncbi:MAG TPA: hypothetical protein ENK43_15510 [Planctomycetes bacterium]|nr:hypothetical protein [Planctomycetota bacterium]
MKSIALFLILAAAASLGIAQGVEKAAPKPAETPPTAKSRPTDIVEASALRFVYYRPRAASAREVAAALQDLYLSHLSVKTDSSNSRRVREVQTIGDSLVFYSTPDRIEKLRSLTKKIEEAFGGQEAMEGAERFVTARYAPRFISLTDALQALQSFQRSITVDPSRGQTARNISQLSDRGIVMLRDTKKNVDEMLRILNDLDQPRTQLTLECLVIRGWYKAESANLPPDLVTHMKQLTEFSGFERLTGGIVRMTATGPSVSLNMAGKNSLDASLDLRPSGYDQATRTLSLSRVDFQVQQVTGPGQPPVRQRLSTSTSLPVDRYTVLGAMGEQPIFLVFRIRPD